MRASFSCAPLAALLVAACTITTGPPVGSTTCKASPTDVATSELSPHYDVTVADGTAHANAWFSSTRYSNNYELVACEELRCNGQKLGATNDALIVFDQSYFATVPAADEGASYHFELHRHDGTVVPTDVAATSLALTAPAGGAVLHRGAPVRVAWAAPSGDEDVAIMMTVQSGRQAGAQVQGSAHRREGAVVLDGFDFDMSAGESFDVTIGATAVVTTTLGAPFAGGEASVTARAEVSVTLAP